MANLRFNRRHRYGLPVFFIALVCLLTACGEQSIASTDDEAEANRMLDILYSKSLNVKKKSQTGEKPGWVIVVDEGWFGEGEGIVAMQMLNDYGLPRRRELLPEATNPYGMTSEGEVKKRQTREKEIQIANHLYALPGVTTVSVIIAQPENDMMSLEKTPPTASVLIVQKEPQPKFTHADVQKIVSGTVSELKAENITVSISEQAPREIPLAQLEAQRRSNKILAGGIGLITLLVAALAATWLLIKRRKRLAETNLPALSEGDETEALNAANQPILRAANDDVL